MRIENLVILVILGLILLIWLLKPRVKGYIGEKTVAIILLCLKKSQYKILHNILLKSNGKTAQIDHIIISKYGIFVIETKNYKGWIFGNEHSEYWTQIIYKTKQKFYNPIRQNYGHVLALKNLLKQYPNIRLIPIVAFSNKAKLKVKVNSTVIYYHQLLKNITGYREQFFSNQDVNNIFNEIKAANNRSDYNIKPLVGVITKPIQNLI